MVSQPNRGTRDTLGPLEGAFWSQPTEMWASQKYACILTRNSKLGGRKTKQPQSKTARTRADLGRSTWGYDKKRSLESV